MQKLLAGQFWLIIYALRAKDGHSNSLASVYIWQTNNIQEPNPTANVLMMLDSKRRLVVFTFRILLSNKKRIHIVYHFPKALDFDIQMGPSSLFAILKSKDSPLIGCNCGFVPTL